MQYQDDLKDKKIDWSLNIQKLELMILDVNKIEKYLSRKLYSPPVYNLISDTVNSSLVLHRKNKMGEIDRKLRIEFLIYCRRRKKKIKKAVSKLESLKRQWDGRMRNCITEEMQSHLEMNFPCDSSRIISNEVVVTKKTNSINT